MKPKIFVVCAVAATALLFGSCKKSQSITGQSNTNSSTMRVRMTDAPADYAGLKVNIVSVEVLEANKGWVMLNSQSQIVSVLDLTNGLSTDLAFKTNADAGLYTKVKLLFGDTNNKIDVNADASLGGTSVAGTFDLEWDGAKEIEIPVSATVSASGETDILLDFDAAASIKENLGKYVIKPVIHEVVDVKTGVKGSIDAGAHALIQVTGVKGTFSTYADSYGNFELKGLEADTYSIKIAKAPTTIVASANSTYTLNGIIVSKGEIKSVGVVKF